MRISTLPAPVTITRSRCLSPFDRGPAVCPAIVLSSAWLRDVSVISFAWSLAKILASSRAVTFSFSRHSFGCTQATSCQASPARSMAHMHRSR